MGPHLLLHVLPIFQIKIKVFTNLFINSPVNSYWFWMYLHNVISDQCKVNTSHKIIRAHTKWTQISISRIFQGLNKIKKMNIHVYIHLVIFNRWRRMNPCMKIKHQSKEKPANPVKVHQSLTKTVETLYTGYWT